jgi:formylglycine-generating enzyme
MKLVRILTMAVLVGLSIEFAKADEVPVGFSATAPANGPQIKTEQGYMVPYSVTIPGSDVKFEMVPIPPGKFKLGSPADESGRKEDEGPQVEIEVPAFWMGKCEVTWGEYKCFMRMNDLFRSFETAGIRKVTPENEADAVTAPSNPFQPEVTFAYGDKPTLPAVNMSQLAAKQYTKWLSKLTGQTYRLPTEAEWEYACRAGATTAYSFGNDSSQLGDYGWSVDNSESTPHEVGLKKPNAWGLYDMHGNVAEWVLDEYTADGYRRLAGKLTKSGDAVAWPTKLYPRVLRGGTWDNEPAELRSAARMPSSDDEWREQDPNRPMSPCWFTEEISLTIGFRIVRPLATPSKAQLTQAWDADLELIRRHVAARMNEGRGAKGIVDSTLPDEIKKKAK